MSAQHSPSFCFIPPESFAAGRSVKGARPVLLSSSPMRRITLQFVLSKKTAKEVDILEDRKCRIEVLSEPLGHVSDSRAGQPPMSCIRHIAIENIDMSLLHGLRAGDQR